MEKNIRRQRQNRQDAMNAYLSIQQLLFTDFRKRRGG